MYLITCSGSNLPEYYCPDQPSIESLSYNFIFAYVSLKKIKRLKKDQSKLSMAGINPYKKAIYKELTLRNKNSIGLAIIVSGQPSFILMGSYLRKLPQVTEHQNNYS